MSKLPTLLVDADSIAFRIAIALQETFQFNQVGNSVWFDEDYAQELFASRIDRIAEDCGSHRKKMLLCWSSPNRRYFRHDIYPEYKSARKGVPSPVGLAGLVAWAKEHFTSKDKSNLEADDVVSILATSKDLVEGPRIVVSIDKDLLQIPGIHYNWLNPDEGLFEVTPEEGLRHTWMQTLIGDSTDGYKGCPGIGPRKAEAFLDGCKTPEEYEMGALGAFSTRDLGRPEMVLQHNLARLINYSTYNFVKQEPILYE